MSKAIPETELDSILEAVAKFPAGAKLGDVMTQVGTALTRRTMQRRINKLVDAGKVRVEGQGKAIRYFGSTVLPELDAHQEQLVKDTAVSQESLEIKQYTRQPITARRPVEYNRQFLDDYRPNETAYLSDSIRHHLQTLGEDHDGNRPSGTFARQILNHLLIDLSWNSSRLEGNTYSLLETEKLIKFGEEAAGKDAIEAVMILNHKNTIEFMVDAAEDIGFNRYTILNIHALLSDSLLIDPGASGRLRNIAVAIGKSVYYPLEVPQLIDECFTQILDTATAITNPFEQAFFAMVHLPYLQPFIDVNKRVSRLSANIPLIKHNLCPLSFIDVPEQDYIDGVLGVYELNRIELLRDVFVWAYERSAMNYKRICGSLGEPDPFRIQYHSELFDAVASIVRENMGHEELHLFIQRVAAQHVSRDDRPQFIEMVTTELKQLHIGNIARYHIRPSEFEAWKSKAI